MKKIFSMALVVLICFVMASCKSKNTTQNSSSENSVQSSSQTQISSINVSDSGNIVQFITSIHNQISRMEKEAESKDMKFTVSARGKSLVYSHQYLKDIGDISNIKPNLQQTLDSGSPAYKSTLAALRLMVPSAESFIIEYLDKNGNIIVSKEFK